MNFTGTKLNALLGLLGLSVIGSMCALFTPLAPLGILGGLKPAVSDALVWLAGVWLCALLLRIWIPRFAHMGLLGLALLYLAGGVGLVEISIVTSWLALAWCTGAIVLRWCCSSGKNTDVKLSEAILLGFAIWLAVLGVMLHYPVNQRGMYLGLCLLPILGMRSLPAQTVTDMRQRMLGLHGWMRSLPFWQWAIGIASIGWALRWAVLPSVSFDDHAYHLRLWTELLTEQRALFDVRAQVWSVAPFAADLLYAGLSLMAGADTRSATNLTLALLLLLLFVRILHRLHVPVRVQWLLVVLLASTPMLGALLLSMQAELLLAVVGLAGLHLVFETAGGWRAQQVLGVLACAALCAAIKLPGAVFGATIMAALALRVWGQRGAMRTPAAQLTWPALAIVAVLAFVALHSYAVAWRITGNPLFPLYNAVFKSPFAPVANFSDQRWVHGFSLTSYVRLFFKTSEFLESGNYVAGWQYLVLLPLALLAIWRASVPAVLRLALLPLFGFGLAMFSASQYWRYLFPVMPFAGILFAALFMGKNRKVQRAVQALALLIIVLNFAVFSKISWLTSQPAGNAYTQAGKQEFIRMFAPAAVLTEKVNQLATGARVFYPPDAPYGAGLHGTPVYANFYSPDRDARYAALKDQQAMADFLAQEKVDFAILSMADMRVADSPQVLLRNHVAKYGSVVAQEGPFLLYRLSDSPELYRTVFDSRTARQMEPRADGLPLPFPEAGLTATQSPQVAPVRTLRAKQARYSAHFQCTSEQGFLIAQINWDKGPPYYRLVPCRVKGVSFTENIPIPFGASEGLLYVSARDTAAVQVEDVLVEVN
ncbi:hypothetical protein [Pseudoduganella violaceinigra]|uniref:hypothetical protein n=1 Tax=Pseudoduganella violaceinigra TaxID=246602 RepID=UPI0012B608D2|nr:hypothetical protein [Pseudoduganella violaceinigra]